MIPGLVSVIIPTYNRAGRIGETIRSVLSQTYREFEVLVIDDGSTDDTAAVVERIADSRIRYRYFDNSGLPAVARNRGMRMARGEFIAFLDSDDLWLPRKLSLQTAYLNSNPGVFLVYTPCILRSDGRDIDVSPSRLHAGLIFNELYRSYNFISCMSVMMRNGENGPGYFFDEDRRLRAMEDYELWLKIALKERIGYIKEPLAVYVLHDSNISTGIFANLRKWKIIMDKYRPFVSAGLATGKYLSWMMKCAELSALYCKRRLTGDVNLS